MFPDPLRLSLSKPPLEGTGPEATGPGGIGA
jgi:hypothetical protein